MKTRPSGARPDACIRKRRYPTQGHALEAAMLAGVERGRTAYLCSHCGQWHLSTKSAARSDR